MIVRFQEPLVTQPAVAYAPAGLQNGETYYSGSGANVLPAGAYTQSQYNVYAAQGISPNSNGYGSVYPGPLVPGQPVGPNQARLAARQGAELNGVGGMGMGMGPGFTGGRTPLSLATQPGLSAPMSYNALQPQDGPYGGAMGAGPGMGGNAGLGGGGIGAQEDGLARGQGCWNCCGAEPMDDEPMDEPYAARSRYAAQPEAYGNGRAGGAYGYY